MEGIKDVADKRQLLPAKENSLDEESMNGGTCGVYLQIQYVHARVVQLVLAFRSFLSAFRESTAAVGVHTPPRDISTRKRERASPCALILCDSSSFPFAFTTSVSRTPRESTDLFKRRKSTLARRPRQQSLDSRTHLDFRFDIFSYGPFFPSLFLSRLYPLPFRANIYFSSYC